MKILFLDIDGVLNDANTRHVCCSIMGIEQTKIRLLKDIIKATDAKIVLTSTWKNYINLHGPNFELMGDYLEILLKANGLKIHDIVDDEDCDRGEAIYNYVRQHNPDAWAVLDDDVFEDFETFGITDHLIKTNFHQHGLTKELAEKTIHFLTEHT